jgi:glycosyltransferase involved in cell wall biosynthesis
MQRPISLSLFFPTYNEEENIRELLHTTLNVVQSSPYVGDYELLVIDDGSRDRTRELAESVARTHPQVRVVSHTKNKGYGAALKTGIREARMDYIFFTDADLQFDIVELNSLLAQLAEHEDLVVGYRAPRRDPFMRLVNAKVWNILNRLLFGLKVRDIDCAFKLFRRDLVQKLRLRSNGAMINAEMLIRLARSGVTIKEIPVTHLARVSGSPTGAKPSVILRAFREMVNLYRGELGLVTHKQALKFAVVGVINTAIDLTLYFIMTRVFFLPIVPSKFLSFMGGTVSSLTLNRLWTFGLRERLTLAEVVRFYSMISLSIAINVGTVYVSVQMLGLPEYVGIALATLGSFAASYTLSRLWVFRSRGVQMAAA